MSGQAGNNERPQEGGFVYVIHAAGTNRIKIGHSADPEKRLAQLQTGSPYELKLLGQWPGTVEVEQFVHQRLAQYRCGGEWFSVPPFIGSVIHQAIQSQKWDRPSIWGKLWRLERNGDYYRWRLAFTPERCSRTGGKITPEISRILQGRPGHGRHAASRVEASRLRSRALDLAGRIRSSSRRGSNSETGPNAPNREQDIAPPNSDRTLGRSDMPRPGVSGVDNGDGMPGVRESDWVM